MNRMREAIQKSSLGPASVTGTNGKQCFCFNESFIGFAGHFPGYPILPGVLQNLLGQVVAEQVIGHQLQFKAINRAKFSRQLRPDDQIDVDVSCQEKDGKLHCKTQIRVGTEEASIFTLVLEQGATIL